MAARARRIIRGEDDDEEEEEEERGIGLTARAREGRAGLVVGLQPPEEGAARHEARRMRCILFRRAKKES